MRFFSEAVPAVKSCELGKADRQFRPPSERVVELALTRRQVFVVEPLRPALICAGVSLFLKK